jgi:hypothetical protein
VVDEAAQLVAAIRAVSDTDAARRLAVDAWAATDRVASLAALLGWVREYAGRTRPAPVLGTSAPAGEVRGVKVRPAAVACWWLGRAVTKTKVKPAMGFCDVGKALPAEAKFWCVEGQGYWWRVPNRG